MDPSSRELLQAAGADADGFHARDLTPALIAGADLVLTAAREHRAAAARLHPAALRRAMTLRDLADLLTGVGAADVAAAGLEGTWVAQTVAFAAVTPGAGPRSPGRASTSPTRSVGRVSSSSRWPPRSRTHCGRWSMSSAADRPGVGPERQTRSTRLRSRRVAPSSGVP